jgi:hypothetical protein
MFLHARAEKPKRRAKGDFKGRLFESWLIIQAVSWYLRYPLRYRDLESLPAKRGSDVDHATINRWILALCANDRQTSAPVSPTALRLDPCRTARRKIAGFEAMLWLRKGFGFVGDWTPRRQNELLALCFGIPEINKA